MTKKEKERIVRAAWNKYKELRPVVEKLVKESVRLYKAGYKRDDAGVKLFKSGSDIEERVALCQGNTLRAEADMLCADAQKAQANSRRITSIGLAAFYTTVLQVYGGNIYVEWRNADTVCVLFTKSGEITLS